MSLSLVTRAYERCSAARSASSATAPARWRPRMSRMQPGDVAILENTRFHAARRRTTPSSPAPWPRSATLRQRRLLRRPPRPRLDRRLARLLPAYAGRAMEAELKALQKALGEPERPVAAVVGGAKVSTKLDVLRHLVAKVDHLIIGGGMANTFLAARGVAVGKSLCEHDLTDTALEILDAADRANCTVHLPYDVVVAKEFAPNPPSSAPATSTKSPPTR
jgi:phosphoglycerate kinase